MKALAGSDVVASAEVAGPGFVNLRLRPAAFHAELEEIRRAGKAWGARPPRRASASTSSSSAPTPPGPVTVASGRNAILGDSIGAAARGHRLPRHARVLHQRPRQPGAPLRRERARRGRGARAARGRVQGRVRRRARGLAAEGRPGPLAGDVETLGRTCVTLDASRHPRLERAPRGAALARRSSASSSTCGSARNPCTAGARSTRSMRPARGRRATSSRRTARSSSRRRRAPSRTRTAWCRKPTAPRAYFASDIAYFADKIARGYDRLHHRARRRPPWLRRARAQRADARWAFPPSGSRPSSTSSSTSRRAARRSRAASATATSSPSTR